MKAAASRTQNSLNAGSPISTAQASASYPIFDPPTEAIRHCEIGKLMLSRGQYQAALQQFEQGLALPHAIAAWCGRSEALACLNRYEEALRSIEQAQMLSDLTDTQIWVQKAVVLIFLQRYEEALSCCTLILQRHPHHVQALLFQGVALHRLGQYRKAYRSYRQVTELSAAPMIDRP